MKAIKYYTINKTSDLQGENETDIVFSESLAKQLIKGLIEAVKDESHDVHHDDEFEYYFSTKNSTERIYMESGYIVLPEDEIELYKTLLLFAVRLEKPFTVEIFREKAIEYLGIKEEVYPNIDHYLPIYRNLSKITDEPLINEVSRCYGEALNQYQKQS